MNVSCHCQDVLLTASVSRVFQQPVNVSVLKYFVFPHSSNTNSVKYFYTNRIVLAWNSLSDTVVTASSVNAFRKQLNAANLEKFLIVG